MTLLHRLVARFDLDCVEACIRMEDARMARAIGLPDPDRRSNPDRRTYRAAVRAHADRRRAARRSEGR